MFASAAERPATLDHLWQAVLGRLEVEMTTPNFVTWLEGTRALDQQGQVVTVAARSAFACDWLNERLRPLVERVMRQVAGEALEVWFVVSGFREREEERVGGEPAVPRGRLIGAINATFTIETYLETRGNALARRACSDLLEDTSFSLSPIVLYGRNGVGKTHLLHGISQAACKQGWTVACLSSEQFTNRYATAIREKDARDFQSTMRDVRLLVLDDLHYLAGKGGVANELTHTIDAVMTGGGDVMIASERHPAEIDLPERLVSRLTSGLVSAIKPFEAGERRSFVVESTARSGVALPEWAVDRLASLQAPSVRELRGAVARALAMARHSDLTIEALDADLAAGIVSRLTVTREASPEAILERVARVFEVAAGDLVGRTRRREVTAARAVAAAALQERGMSLAQIATVLGNRDRSTVRALAERGRQLAEGDAAIGRVLGASA